MTPAGPPRVLQIVPFRTSRNDGIGDYARVLADALERRHGLRTTFISGTPAGVDPEPDDGWETCYVAERSGHAFLEALHAQTERLAPAGVILHVGGYGYAKRGIPFWLLNGLMRWRAANPGGKLVGVFHELYASGRPWNSSFWLGPLQKIVARGIWRLADSGVTTNSLYLDELTQWRPAMRERLLLMPVPSSVGEPEHTPPFAARARRAVVFGAAGAVAKMYGELAAESARMVRALGVDEIIDIGTRREPPPARLGDAIVKPLGRLAAEDVSRVLLTCRFGLMNYDPVRLGKSTVFASYAAHGVIPTLVGATANAADGLSRGRHVLMSDEDTRLPVSVLAGMQGNLIQWYDAHSSHRQADALARLMTIHDTSVTNA